MARRVVLRKIYAPQKAQGPPNLDLVLIHGLDGDPIKTWQDGECGTLWPKDLLPLIFPRTRVWSFGYNADIYRNNSVASIRDNARSLLQYLELERRPTKRRDSLPIVFVAHCLGGLIVKQAMHFASFDPAFSRTDIAFQTQLIVFFGTPHQGITKEQWDQIVEGYAVRDGPLGKRTRLVDTMRRDSAILSDITCKFRQMADDYDITSFYERRPWKGTDACIVNETAAQMAIENEIARPVDADHIAMCRFSSISNFDFRLLCRDIENATGIEAETPDEDEAEIGEETSTTE
ncbi:Protein SERAC1, partial [Madurella mycetomatis]